MTTTAASPLSNSNLNQHTQIPATTKPGPDAKKSESYFSKVSMPSFSFANGVANAAVYGAVGTVVMDYLAPAYSVSVLTGAVACGVAKLASNILADKVSALSNRILSILIGSTVATAVGGSIAFSACTLSVLTGPLSFFGFAAVSASVGYAMQLIGNTSF